MSTVVVVGEGQVLGEGKRPVAANGRRCGGIRTGGGRVTRIDQQGAGHGLRGPVDSGD